MKFDFGFALLIVEVCGGDVSASIWHLESRSLATVLPCSAPFNIRYTVAKMDAERILVGSTCPLLFEVSLKQTVLLLNKGFLRGN